MADRLTVQVKLDTTQAKKNLADLISQMKKAEEAGAKFKKSLNNSADVVGDLGKVDKAMNGVTNASNKAESSMKKLKGSTDTLGSSFEKVGAKFSKAFGSNLQTSLTRSIGFMKQLASTALMVGGAISGVSAYKTFNDYTEFSKKAGTVNAIVGGDANTQRLIENSLLGATAGTTQKSSDIANSAVSFASTPMFNPSEGGKYNRNDKEYQENVMKLGPITQRAGAFASSQGTDIKTIMDGAMLIATAQGDNLKDISKGGGLEKTLDWMNGLSNVSIGDPAAVFSNISKFAGTAHAAGVNMNTAGALYASLTPTFTEDESGVRTNSVINWAMRASKTEGRLKDVDPAFAKKFDALVYSKGPDGKEYKNSIESIIIGATKLLADPSLGVRERDKLTAAMDPEVRQGQGRNTAAAAISSGMFDNIQKQMNDTKGLSAKSIASFNESSGAKISMFFNGMESGLQATTGALIDLFSSPEKFNVKSWEEAMGSIGDALKVNLGEGAAKPIEWLTQLVQKIKSSEGQQFIKDIGIAAKNLGDTLGSIASTTLNIVTSEPAQAIFKWATSNPVTAIAVTMVGGPMLQEAIKQMVTAGITAAFANPGLILAIAGITAAYLAVDYFRNKGDEEKDRTKSNLARAQDIYNKDPSIENARALAIAGVEDSSASKKQYTWDNLKNEPVNMFKTLVDDIGNNTILPIANAIADPKKFPKGFDPADWTGTKDSISTINKTFDGASFVKNLLPNNQESPKSRSSLFSFPQEGMGILSGSLKALGSSLGIQDKKVGDGADKLGKTADGFTGVIAQLSGTISLLNGAVAHLGSLQIPGATGGGGGGSPTSSSTNKSFWGAIQRSINSAGKSVGL